MIAVDEAADTMVARGGEAPHLSCFALRLAIGIGEEKMNHKLLTYRFASAAIFLAVIAFASAGRADENTAKAKQFYEEAVTDYNLGHYDSALHSFESAYRLRRDASFLFNIGQCQRQLLQYENARRSFQAYLRESPNVPDQRRQQVEGLITQMESAIADQRKQQPPTGTEAPSGVVSTGPPKTGDATPANSATVAPPRISLTTRDRGGSNLRLAGIVVGSFGIAAIAAGGGFYGVAKSANDELNQPGNGKFSAASESKRDTFQALDIASFIIGGAAIVTGVVVYVAGWRRDRRMSLRATSTTQQASNSLVFKF
jgi:tetratricopeptide (TPR) repeat protein